MEKEILNILEKLMSFKTIESNIEEIKNIYNYIESIIPSNFVVKKYTFKGKPALVIANTSSKKFDVAFCGHVDVVPSDIYNMTIKDGKIYGRGAIDMKGSVAIILNLLKNLNTNKKVGFLITSDEEIDGYSAMKLLEIYDAKLGIVPDGGSNFELIVEEKGLLQLKLTTKTISAHASAPYKGENAVLKLMNVYNKIIQQYPLPYSEDDYITSINLSKIKGGDAINKVPDFAQMFLDIRNTSENSHDEIINFIKNIDKEVNVELIYNGPLFKTEITEDINKYINICESILKRKVKLKKYSSTCDAVYFSEKEIPTIIMNPNGGNAHSQNEFVTIDGLVKLYKIYDKFINEER